MDGKLHGSLQLLMREQRGSAKRCSLMSATGLKVKAWSCIRGGLNWVLGKGYAPEGGWALEQASWTVVTAPSCQSSRNI